MPDETSNSVAGRVDGNVLQAGSINFYPPQRPAVGLPHRAGVVPLRATAFQERAAPVAGTTVLSGLGGVGKTQLAADYAERVWAAGEVELLVWITAASREAIVSTYARVHSALTGVDDPDAERGARALLEWLAGTAKSWLVVLDDVQSPGDVSGLWPPETAHGRVVVTTRRRDAALRGHPVEVDVFTVDEALAYLRAAMPADLLDEADELVRELGCLPLALAQASAYLKDRRLPCAAYLVRLAERRLAAVLPEPEALPDEHRATVAATWSLSVEQADRLTPVGVARPLLEVASVLDANGIPAGVFTAPAVLELLGVGEEDAKDGLGCLNRLSLITRDDHEVRVHAMVQRATRDALPAERLQAVVCAAADALTDVWPVFEKQAGVGQIMRANAHALHAVGGESLWRNDCYKIFIRLGWSLGLIGLAAEARDQFDELHTAAVRHLGSDHPTTLNLRSNLAHWQASAGDPVGAAAVFLDLLVNRLQVQGPDHPDTLAARHEIARCLGEAGNPAGAAAEYADLLNDRLRVLGPDHIDTLNTRLLLAQWKEEARDVAALEELVADCLRVLGPGHPDTLRARVLLAQWQVLAGDLDAAVPALEEVFVRCRGGLGPDNPVTLSIRALVGYCQGFAGDPARAVKSLEAVLDAQRRVLGHDHPHTLATADYIAYWKSTLSG